MTINRTLLSADRYMVKYLMVHDGGTEVGADAVTIFNNVLMTDMVEGPLKNLWTPTYATQAAARAALNEGAHMEVIQTPRKAASVGGLPWGFDVVITNNLAGLAVFGNPDCDSVVVALNYRHSTGR